MLENAEEDYEKKPRLTVGTWKSNEHIRLPLKDKTGIIQQNFNHVENSEYAGKPL